MKWAHNECDILTGKPLFLPGTLVYLNLEKASLIEGNTPFDGIFNGRLIKTGDFNKSPVAMIVGLDCLENHYRVLMSEKLYWISVEAISLAAKSTGRASTAN